MKSQCPPRPDLDALLTASVEAFARMTPTEQRAMRRAQAISFAYGNLAIENDRITREMVEKAYDER
jgi:hypothetical protein